MVLLVVLVPPLFRKKRSSRRELHSGSKRSFDQSPVKFVVLLSMLGIGFMLAEISLIQRFVLFLGQPVLSLAVLLFSLLVGAGIGSMCSGRLNPDKIIKGIAITASVGIPPKFPPILPSKSPIRSKGKSISQFHLTSYSINIVFALSIMLFHRDSIANSEYWIKPK